LHTADEPKIEPGKDIPDGYGIDIVVADVMKSTVDCAGRIGGVNSIRKVVLAMMMVVCATGTPVTVPVITRFPPGSTKAVRLKD
jgi:hypothetical protein